jgi:hypothetical protein
MTPSDEVFSLIKSLTAHEKRYFKVWASSHVIGKSNHYEKLFDALDTLPDDKPYDESEFKKALRGKSYGKNLSDEKSNLKEIILRAMRVYHAEKTPEGKLLEMIHEIRFLYNKGLMKSCLALIEKAHKLAEETEQYSMMLTINDFLMSLFNVNKLSNIYSAKGIEESEQKTLEKLNLNRQASYLRIKITDISISGHWAKRSQETDEIMKMSQNLSQQNDLTVRAELAILNTQQFYLLNNNKFEECLELTEKWLKKYEANPSEYSFISESYKTILANYLKCILMAEKFDLIPPAIEKLKSLKTNDERDEANIFRLATQYELVYLLNTSRSQNYQAILQHIANGVHKYIRYIPEADLINIKFNTCLSYFLQKDYSATLSKINDFYLDAGRDERFVFVTSLARTIEWMCQYKMENYSILDPCLRNLKRHYKEKNLTTDLHEKVISLFAALIKDAGMNKIKNSDIKKTISDANTIPEWEQLRELVLVCI